MASYKFFVSAQFILHNLDFLFFFFRKHTLNCHRMKPALFSVLCEIKEKTGKFHYLLLLLFDLVSCEETDNNVHW